MLSASQIRADFEKLRSSDHEHGEIVTLGFNGSTCRAIKSSRTRTVTLHEYGEQEGDMFTLRFLVTDFERTPAEKDVVTVDSVEYQVGEVRTSGLGQVVRLFIMDVES